MMKVNLSLKPLLLILLISVLYFVLRLPNLTLQPIFADEAIYIRWAQVMKSEPTLRFISLTDGKTPLFMWTMIPMFKIFSDPLFAGRFLSILSGFATLLGVLFVGWKVFSLRAGIWAAVLYAVVPYGVFFDRIALVDSMLASFTIWSLYFSLWLAKTPRLDLSMILGYLLGGSILVKTPGFLNIFSLPVTILGFKKTSKYSLVKLLIFWLVSVIIALIIYNILRLGPGFSQLSGRNGDYIFSPLDLIDRPLDPLIPHFRDIVDWFPKLLTWPVLAAVLIGTVYLWIKKIKFGGSVLLWALVPLLIQSIFLRTFTARYLFFSIPLLLLIAAYGIDSLLTLKKGKLWVKVLLMLLLILPLPLNFDRLLIKSPENAPLPKEERSGYFEEWTAGYGFKQIAQYLIDQKKQGPVVVGTEGSFGTLPDGLMIYLDKANIAVIGGQATISAGLRDAALNSQVFFVANRSRMSKKIEDTILIKEYPKAKSEDSSLQDSIILLKVLPERKPQNAK